MGRIFSNGTVGFCLALSACSLAPDYERPPGAFWLFRNAEDFRKLAAQYEQRGSTARSE